MKKQLLTVFSIVFVLAFAVAVYAFNQNANSGNAAALSCAKSGNCPLRNKNAQTAEDHAPDSCCGKADCCCCKGDSCPMKASGENASADCCGNCCGGSCPMKNKQTAATATAEKEIYQLNRTAGS